MEKNIKSYAHNKALEMYAVTDLDDEPKYTQRDMRIHAKQIIIASQWTEPKNQHEIIELWKWLEAERKSYKQYGDRVEQLVIEQVLQKVIVLYKSYVNNNSLTSHQ